MLFRMAMLMLACLNTASAAFSQTRIAERIISAGIVNPQDLSEVDWPTPSILAKPAVIKSDDTIFSILQANGIYPDSEALTIVYDLNPALTDARQLQEGTSLQLPAVTPEADLHKLTAAGYLARVSVDPEVRNALSQDIKTLQELVPASAGVTSTPAQQQLKDLAQWYVQIDRSYRRRTGPPLRRETLVQLSDEAAALDALLEAATKSKRSLSPDDEAQIGAIHDDLTKVISTYGQALGAQAPKSEDKCDVTVTIKGTGLIQDIAVRVYYTFNGLYREPPSDPPVRSSEWTKLGSGHSERLLNDKNYKLWAARDGDPGHPLTAPFRLETACGSGPAAVELSVLPKVP